MIFHSTSLIEENFFSDNLIVTIMRNERFEPYFL